MCSTELQSTSLKKKLTLETKECPKQRFSHLAFVRSTHFSPDVVLFAIYDERQTLFFKHCCLLEVYPTVTLTDRM